MPASLTEAQRSGIPRECPSAVRLGDGSRFALITWGSSSCPAVVTAMEALGTAAIELRLESSGGSGPCSADIAATTHELAVPGTATGSPISLTLTYAHQGEPTTLSIH